MRLIQGNGSNYALAPPVLLDGTLSFRTEARLTIELASIVLSSTTWPE